ncbi:MAG TPA: SCO family protein [Pyrinomonadaceae bacterium]|jgi:protein SCO1/2
MGKGYDGTLVALAAALLLCAAPPATRAQAAATSVRPDAAGTIIYSCPMHPEVKSKKKGQCPKCKMDLRPVPAETTPDGAGMSSAEAGADMAHASDAPSKMSIPDVELLDQDGRKVHFYTDLVKGKVVAVQFIFTTCTTICPPLGATFARVQKELGERAGRDVRLISLSVDPATDTPERMKAWGAKFHAGDGWTFVTGAKPQVDELLRALGAGVASPADHTPTVLIGNDAAGQWTRAYGLTRPAVLVKLIGDAFDGRLAPPPSDPTGKEQAQP